MNQFIINTHTTGRSFTKIVCGKLSHWNIMTGFVNIFSRHTSASLVITENTDPTVLSDLKKNYSMPRTRQ